MTTFAGKPVRMVIAGTGQILSRKCAAGVLLFVLVLFLLIGGCATPTTQQVRVDDVAAALEAEKQRAIALEAWFKDKHRLVDVAYRVFARSVPLCEDRISSNIGILVANRYMFDEEMREAAFSLYGISQVLKIVHVMPGSAGEKAGLQDGDVPLSVNGWSVPIGEQAGGEFQKKVVAAGEKEEQVTMKVIREGTERVFHITPDRICDYKIALSNDDVVNAFADGEHVVVARGMMRFTENDTELALVVSHELAHNVMQHMKARTQNYVLGSLFDIIAAAYGVNTQGVFGSLAARAYAKEFEAEADYVGLYMMALSGMNIRDAPNFWRRMAAIHPGNIGTNFTATHPATPYRFVALEKTVQEIEGKIDAGQPLHPELKKEIVDQ